VALLVQHGLGEPSQGSISPSDAAAAGD